MGAAERLGTAAKRRLTARDSALTGHGSSCGFVVRLVDSATVAELVEGSARALLAGDEANEGDGRAGHRSRRAIEVHAGEDESRHATLPIALPDGGEVARRHRGRSGGTGKMSSSASEERWLSSATRTLSSGGV